MLNQTLLLELYYKNLMRINEGFTARHERRIVMKRFVEYGDWMRNYCNTEKDQKYDDLHQENWFHVFPNKNWQKWHNTSAHFIAEMLYEFKAKCNL